MGDMIGVFVIFVIDSSLYEKHGNVLFKNTILVQKSYNFSKLESIIGVALKIYN